MWTVEYVYDVNGIVILRTETDHGTSTPTSEQFIYDIGSQPGGLGGLDGLVLVLDADGGVANGDVTRRILHGGRVDQVLAEESAADGVLWSVTDHLGSIRGWLSYNSVSDETTVAAWLTYSAFGEVLSAIAVGGTPQVSWLHSYTGRWVSEDPIGFAAGDVNLVRYVANGPIGARDPSGLASFPQMAPGANWGGTANRYSGYDPTTDPVNVHLGESPRGGLRTSSG